MTLNMNTLRLFEILLPTRTSVQHIPEGMQHKFLVKEEPLLLDKSELGTRWKHTCSYGDSWGGNSTTKVNLAELTPPGDISHTGSLHGSVLINY